MNIHQIHIGLNALDFWALFGCVGLLITRVWLLSPEVFRLPEWSNRWRALLGLCLTVLTVTGLALLLVRTMEMGKSALPATLLILPAVLAQTHFGRVWSIHLFALAILWIGWIAGQRFRSCGWAAFMLAAVPIVAFTFSASSHAGDQGDFSAAELNDWLHILSASAWGGGIVATAIFVLPALTEQADQRRALLADTAGRLSRLSAVALMVVLITGIYNAGLRLGNLGQLVNSSYGKVLAIKLTLVAVMVFIGAANRFLVVRAMGRSVPLPEKMGRTIRWFGLALRADTVFTLLVLVAAAVLINGMPPSSKEMPMGGDAASQPASSSGPAATLE